MSLAYQSITQQLLKLIKLNGSLRGMQSECIPILWTSNPSVSLGKADENVVPNGSIHQETKYARI